MEKITYDGHPIFVRDGSSDTDIMKNLKHEYLFPKTIEAKVIFDIGANIGLTSIWLSDTYPNASIFSFEPNKENYEILKLNTKDIPSIHIFNFGLGSKNLELKLYDSDDPNNFGGKSFFNLGCGQDYTMATIRSVREIIFDFNLRQIDIIKIDTEGSEYDILTSIPNEIMKKVSLIEGELHGEKDYETLHYLSLFFDVAIMKKFGSRCFPFKCLKI